MPHDPWPKNYGPASQQEPCAASLAVRPASGLSRAEANEVRSLVRCLVERELGRLPDGRQLPQAVKERLYASVAVILSAQFGRSVTVEQVKLEAQLTRSRVDRPGRYTTSLSPDHHQQLKAVAEAQGTSIVAVNRAALDAYLGRQ